MTAFRGFQNMIQGSMHKQHFVLITVRIVKVNLIGLQLTALNWTLRVALPMAWLATVEAHCGLLPITGTLSSLGG